MLGGGHGGYAAAADLSEQGHEVRWWRRDAESFASVVANRQVRLRDARGVRSITVARATLDIGQAVSGAAVILMPLPAFAQEEVARALAPFVSGEQVILLTPGTFGSVAMARTLMAAGARALPALAETGTLPYLCRKRSPEEIAITMRARRLPTGVFPAGAAATAFPVLGAVYPAIEPVEDALSAALMNAGPIIHPPLVIMNAGPLEHFERWDVHNEGTQPSIRRVTDALDEERIAVREALGYKPYHFPLRDHYSSDRWMYGAAHEKLTESGDWREHISLYSHRYVREDIEYGLAFMASVAAWSGVPVPVARGLLAIATAFGGVAPQQPPVRSLERLGLAHLSQPQMREVLQRGFAAGPAASP